MSISDNLGLVPSPWYTGVLGYVKESFAGAWQSGITIGGPSEVLSFSAVFACVTGIASDIGKLCIELKQKSDSKFGAIGVLVVDTSPYWAVLRNPNHYQTCIQFLTQWIVSKLLYGNTYILKERDGNGIVVALYILDAQKVRPAVSTNGDVYYQLAADYLSGVTESVTVPAREIIHDVAVALWHPLVGVSPLYACALSATQGNKIQKNSTHFFQNMSRPSGMLLAPGKIEEQDAIRIKAAWEENFGGGNIGRLAVLGSGMTYQATAIPAQTAQLIEQLKWTTEDCARAFRYPMFKITGAIPTGSTVEALNLMYLTDCLHPLIESIESCLDDGLGLTNSRPLYYTEFDLTGLLRMDATAQAAVLAEYVKGAIMAPNEARAKVDLAPVNGGDSPYLQQQNFSLEALAKRDALPNPFVIDRPTANPTPSGTGPAAIADPNADANKTMLELLDTVRNGLKEAA